MGAIPLKQCGICKHLRRGQDIELAEPGLESVFIPTCDAYPDGIPGELIRNEADHTKPYPGDNGIRFEQE
jgi:hypothetical protein